MGVSPSTIVLGILTCIPFGLAIRDTVKGPAPEPSFEDGDPDRIDPEFEDAKYEQERAEATRAYEREREAARKREDVIGQLFDTSAGNLSSRFKVLTGEPYDALPEVLVEGQDTLAADFGLDIRAELVDGILHGITIEPRIDADDTHALCESMASWFDDNWGEADESQVNRKIWLYTTLKRRAVFLTIGSNCKVVVERTVPIDEWITKTPESIVPVWAIGQTPAKLASTLKLATPTTGDTFEWKGPGLGASTGKTELVAYVKGGKIIGLVAHASHAYGSGVISEHLESVFGPPSPDDAGLWKTRPPIALDDAGSRVTVTIGKVPE